jgi:thiamine-phosphate pyrophosphorylase
MGSEAMAARCQLYLSIPAGFSGPLGLVEEVLAAARAPSLLVTGEGDSERLDRIVAAAHRQNAIVLTDTPAQMETLRRFDGVHLPSGGPPVRVIREALGAEKVIGVDSRLSRHEAMTFGETGADYIAFGRGMGFGSIGDLAEMVDWWSGLFEIPCAVFLDAGAPADAWRMIAEAGADFIVPGAEIWDDAGAVRERVEAIAAACCIEGAYAVE